MLDPALDGPERSVRPRSAARRAIQRALAAACLAVAGALVASCTIVLNVGDYAVGDCTSNCSACGFTFASAKCASCVEKTCCAEANACHDDGACAPLYDCVTACGATDAKCRNACAAKHPIGDDAPAQALEACLSQSDHCGPSCSTCGGLADWYADACAACVQEKCCEHAMKCADDAACAERQRCYRACTYPSCPFDCDNQIAVIANVPPASDAIEHFDKCTSAGCGVQCAHGGQWGCVGQFAWPAPTAGAMVSVTFDAVHFSTGLPFVGADIVACGRQDPKCAHPLGDVVTTDEMGVKTITVPSGFDGYFHLSAPDAMETLVFLAWPVTVDQHYSVGLDPYDVYTTLVTSGGGTVRDEDGALFVFTYDCLLHPAPHVMLDIDDESYDRTDGEDVTWHFYFIGDTPSSATEETYATGIGGFSNVLPKTVTLTAALKRDNKPPLPLALLPVYVWPKTLTYVSLSPTP